MASAHDVARYFIALSAGSDEEGISNMKLQKLIYYAQGYHLALHDTPLFAEPIEAWMHGPVCPEVYHRYKAFKSAPIYAPSEDDFTAIFSPEQIELLDEVYEVFGQFAAWKLRDMTHEETPWRYHEKNASVIPHDEMRNHFKTSLN
ncbi:MAG: SocA family protein [Chlorobaculum sp.]|nr:SocA family protein [Chlorobaculum sp.]